MKYSVDYQTRWHDTDAERRVRPSAILVYMQETSNRHVAESGMSLDELRDTKGLAFILSKIKLSFLRPLYAFEDIRVETFTASGRGYSSTRFFRILSGDEAVAEAETTWALIDTKEKQLRRFEETGYVFEDEEPISVNAPPRTRMPSGLSPVTVGERTIVYSDLDYNMHMNNTRYPDMLCDYMPIDAVSKIKSMTLSYVKEAAFGDTVSIKRAERDGVYYFRTLNSHGDICLEAVVVTEQ